MWVTAQGRPGSNGKTSDRSGEKSETGLYPILEKGPKILSTTALDSGHLNPDSVLGQGPSLRKKVYALNPPFLFPFLTNDSWIFTVRRQSVKQTYRLKDRHTICSYRVLSTFFSRHKIGSSTPGLNLERRGQVRGGVQGGGIEGGGRQVVRREEGRDTQGHSVGSTVTVEAREPPTLVGRIRDRSKVRGKH